MCIRDSLVGSPSDSTGGGSAGRIFVLDGATGLPAYNPPQILLIGAPGSLTGWAVAGLGGSVDGDAFPDFVSSTPGPAGTGSATIHSGQTGAPILTIPGFQSPENFGWSLDTLGGDVNGNGSIDFIVGALNFTSGGNFGVGRAYVLDGSTGGVIRTHTGGTVAGLGVNLGNAVAGLGDVDGDGIPDYAVGAMNDSDGPFGAQFKGAVRVHSGATGSQIFAVFGDAGGDKLGFDVDSAGDVDNDGVSDLIAGTEAGYVRVYSGASGLVLFTVQGNAADGFGFRVSGAGDLTGEGAGEVLIGAPTGPGAVDVVAPFAQGQNFVGYPPQISLAAGGPHRMYLDAGIDKADEIYWVLGSHLLLPPGFGNPLSDGSLFFLSPASSYYTLTVTKPNGGPKKLFLFFLDGQGQGMASLVIPPGADPTLAGTVLHHQYFVWQLEDDQGNPGNFFNCASQVTSVTLVP